MSALAARRAAQAALAASKESTPVVETPKTTKPRRKQPSPSPEPEAPEDLPSPSMSAIASDDESEVSEPSYKRRKVDSKSSSSAKNTRYYIPPEQSSKPKKKRRFSFSTPQEAADGGDDDGDDDDDEYSEDEADDGQGNDYFGLADPGTPWSGAQSPRTDAGPSRYPASTAALTPITSEFEPVEGVNIHRLSEKVLAAAGLDTSSPGVVVSLAEDENLQIAGTFTVTPLRQSLSLLSTVLKPSEDEWDTYPVYAPTSHPLPVLAPGGEQVDGNPQALKALKLPKSFKADASRTLFLIQEHRCGIEGLRGDVVPGFGNIWLDEKGAWGLRGVHPVVGSFPTPVYPHVTPASWGEALASVCAAGEQLGDEDDEMKSERVPVVIVKGPKRSGKSSLARASLNTLLGVYERVAWLECDLGQGEFSAAGVIGLWVIDRPVLGPPFTHPRVPARAHFLGELSPQSCPDEYMAAIQQLIAHYQCDIQYPLSFGATSSTKRSDVVPLIVNTQGWVKGLGEDLMRGIEASAEPTHILAFQQVDEQQVPSPGNGWTTSPVQHTTALPQWDSGAGTGLAPVVHLLEPAPVSPLQARYNAAEMRALTTISYLHARLGRSKPTWDFSAPLLAQRPLTVDVGAGGPLSRVFLIGESADAILPHDLPYALNANLVALVATDEPSAGEAVYVPGRAPPTADESTVLGLALVRAVRVHDASADSDSASMSLQLLTPLPAKDLARATAIVHNGALELPLCGMLDWRDRDRGGGGAVSEEGIAGWRWGDVPFLDASGTLAVGGQRRKVRRNIQRKGV